jgi:hypothetical protein
MVSNVQGTMKDKQPIALAGYPGRAVRFEIHPAGKSITGLGLARLYLVGDRLYQLLVVGDARHVDEAAAAAFFDSFQLEGKGKPALTGTATTAAVTDWGTVEDPAGDCRIEASGPVATIEVPGTLHDLITTEPGRSSAPRIMQPAEGDFVAEVQVTGEDLPADPPAPGSRLPFHGAGLLLWGSAGDFIRLERAAFVRGGQLTTYVLFEHHTAGAPTQGQDFRYAGGPVVLRMERRGVQVLGSFSTDGTTWQSLAPKTFTATNVKVGVAAVNSASAPFRAQFQGLKIGKP